MSQTSQITFSKLHDGQWGLRGAGLAAGATVTVAKKSGETKTVTVGRVIWEGAGVALATIAAAGSHSHSHSRTRSRSRGTWTGCDCGSVEEFAKASDCWSCRHDR